MIVLCFLFFFLSPIACQRSPPQQREVTDKDIDVALQGLPTDGLKATIDALEVEQKEALAGRSSKWKGMMTIGGISAPMERILPIAKAVYVKRGGTLEQPADQPQPPVSTLPEPLPPVESPPAPPRETPLPSEEPRGPDPRTAFFTHTEADVQKDTVAITTKNPDTNNEERTASYDAYSIPGESFRIICQQPCAIPEVILKKKVVGADAAIRALVDFTGIDVLPIVEPVDIHLTSSVECGDYQEKLRRQGYVSRFSGTRPSGVPGVTEGAYMCLWEFDDDQLIFPLNEENAMRIEAQTVLVHEYAHVLFYRRSFASPEDFIKALQFRVSGIWDGESRDWQDFPLVTDACDARLEINAPSVYQLCTRCGYSMDDLRATLQRIAEIYSRGDGEEIDNKVSMPQLKAIIDDLTGRDSVSECGIDWLSYRGNV